MRLSGFIDVEAYKIAQPAPGLISTDDHSLINPRLALFFDAQLGPKFYLFVQSRPAPEPEPALDPLRESLSQLNPDELSPREALDLLYRLKKL